MDTQSQSLTPRRDPSLHKIAPASGSTRDLVVGIARDAEHMVKRYVELTKLDLRTEVDQTKRALVAIAMAASMLAVAGILLALAAGRALTYVTGLPLGASYAIVGGALVAAGVLLIVGYRNKAQIKPPALEEAKEDVKWIKEHS